MCNLRHIIGLVGAHPRSRGENKLLRPLSQAVSGSSPLTRGKLNLTTARDARPRLIPAHAGKTPSRLPTYPYTPAHPRSRGENCLARRTVFGTLGSSPLTRGKPGAIEELAKAGGLIPAHAGKTFCIALVENCIRAHPRSRGENSNQRHMLGLLTGSSPLTRGKLMSLADNGVVRGLIPAHAGKTPNTYQPRTQTRAHPRSRGENNVCVGCVSHFLGSSPLTRGKQDKGQSGKIIRGLIPAHAGKTIHIVRCQANTWAHPRSRGEN